MLSPGSDISGQSSGKQLVTELGGVPVDVVLSLVTVSSGSCSDLASGKCLALVRRTRTRLNRLRQVTPMNTLLPFQPDAMTPAQLAAVSYLARYSGRTHTLYASQLRRWFAW